MKVAFATPELLSLVRRTNLAEIAEYLPRALRTEGAEVLVFLPFAREVDPGRLVDLVEVGRTRVADVGGSTEVRYLRGQLGDLPVVLVDHPELFRTRNPYGGQDGPYADNWRRYAVFARAVLEGLELLDFAADVIHCLDWTTGLIPILQRLEYAEARPEHPAAKVGTYFAIHNQAMQGSFEREILPKIGIPHRWFQHIEGVELGGRVNYLKAGAEFATIIGTHSPSQVAAVDDLPHDDSIGDTLKRRKKELVGVPSGIDYRSWDPGTDPLLTQPYAAKDKDPTLGKRKCKATLQGALKLDNGPRTPLFCIIGRFDADNGFDVLSETLTPMLERSLQLVMMGPGQPEIIERMHTIEQTFVGRCRIIEGYNVNTAHVLLGGSDVLLLPNHYHASNALCAIGMRYGVVPVAYAHSGLQDTVVDMRADPKHGTGILFPTYSGESLLEGVDEARNAYKNATGWKRAVQHCLDLDFSWAESARNQLKAYRRVTRRVRGR